MSVVIIRSLDIVGAWQAATDHLLGSPHGKTTNLIVEIDDPVVPHRSVLRAHDPKRFFPDEKSVFDVANTIWPSRLVAQCADRAAFYRRYLAVNERGMSRRRNRNRWGTYCGRLLSFGSSRINQLEKAIVSSSGWSSRYEAAIVLHVSSSETDGIRVRGGPCLQYVQPLFRADGTLDLVAVYRSQDYSLLALGNFIGLAELLSFISTQTGNRPGRLIVHSVFASLGKSKRLTKRLRDGV